MTNEEMIQYLQGQFGSLGPITQYAPTAETYAVNPGEQLIAGPNTSYIAGNRRLEPNDRRQNPETGFWNEPSEFITMLRPDPDAQAAENGGGWMGAYDIEGNMVGSPYYQDPQYSWLFDHMDELRTAAAIATMIASGIPVDPSIGMTAAEAAAAYAAAAEAGAGAIGVGTGMTAAEAAAAYAAAAEAGAGAVGAAGATGMTAAEAAAAALASAPEFAAAGTLGSAGAGTLGAAGVTGMTAAEAAAAALAGAPEFAAAGTLGTTAEAAAAAAAGSTLPAGAEKFLTEAAKKTLTSGLGTLAGAGLGAVAANNKGITPMGLQSLEGARTRAPLVQTGVRGTKGQGSVDYFTRPYEKANEEAVNRAYLDLFGRNAEPAGLEFFSKGLDTGQITQQNLLEDIRRGAQNTDIDRLRMIGDRGYAAGGPINQGLGYLRSSEDGMADRINAVIDNRQPAKLSGGEFVIPADVVSHLGNGNSDAGAKQLHEFMSRIRKARTGTPKQGRKINPNKFMPK